MEPISKWTQIHMTYKVTTYWLNIRGDQNAMKTILISDFTSLKIVYPVNMALEDPCDDNIYDNPFEPENIYIQDAIIMYLYYHQEKNITKNT